MNTTYQSTSPIRTLTAAAFALVLSGTCIMAAIGPAAMQSVQTVGQVAQPPIA